VKEVVVLSGKGGTGKTSFVGSFAALLKTPYWPTAMWMPPTCTFCFSRLNGRSMSSGADRLPLLLRIDVPNVAYARSYVALRRLRISGLTLSPVRAVASALVSAQLKPSL